MPVTWARGGTPTPSRPPLPLRRGGGEKERAREREREGTRVCGYVRVRALCVRAPCV